MTLRLPIAVPLLLACLFSAHPAAAQRDSISTALRLVAGYYTESGEITRRLTGPEEDARLSRASLTGRKQAEKRLRELRWTREPGIARFRRAYAILDSYTSAHISSVRKITAGLPRARREEVLSRLSSLRASKLNALDETLKTETYRKSPLKPVPLIDGSPHEDPPAGRPGIRFR